MTKLSKNSELQQSCITAVKSRFFAQYWGQDVCQTKGGRYKLDEDCFPLWEKSYLELKLLSKITDEDAQEIQIITGANHLPKQSLIYACLKKSDAIPVIDFLRSKGYAVPFMEYSVDDLVSFGWVQLL